MKANIPVVIGESNSTTRSVFDSISKKVKSPITYAEDQVRLKRTEINILLSYQTFDVEYYTNLMIADLKIDLPGEYQIKNLTTTLSCVEILRNKRFRISDRQLSKGLSQSKKLTGFQGRFQVLSQEPLTICDPGHNISGVKHILKQLKTIPYKKLHFVIGMVADKSINEILNLLPGDAIYYFTKANIPRAMDEKELQLKSLKFDLKGRCFESVKEAVRTAKKEAKHDDLVFIGGSIFIVAEAM
ncbi:MAG: hypothetical protein IH948_05070 [Bacteroidetes bacterium]|nr:hypothetical protein [Bacteroidota bacterium]